MEHTDPVCGKKVDSEHAAAEAIWGNAHYYFDSTACRDRFEAEPNRYLGAAGGLELERHEPPFTTVDKFATPKFGSAGSGGAEFEPIPEHHREREERRRKESKDRD